MSSTVEAIREDTTSVAAQIDCLGQAFGEIDDELSALKNAAEEYLRAA